MLEDDEAPSSGLGFGSAYQLGRWSAQADQENAELIARLTGTSPVARADYNHAVALNEGLEDENAWLRAEIDKGNLWLREWKDHHEKLKARYDRLKDKADHDAAEIIRMNGVIKALAEDCNEQGDLLEDYENRIADYEEDIAAGRLMYRRETDEDSGSAL